MKNDSFQTLMWQAFTRGAGTILGFLGLVITVATLYFVPNTDVMPVRYAATLLLVCLYFIYVLCNAVWIAFQQGAPKLPKVLRAKRLDSFTTGAEVLILLEPSSLFLHNAVVSIFFVEDDLEQVLSVGRVGMIQDDGKVQVVTSHSEQSKRRWDEILNNDSKVLEKLRVKPSYSADSSTSSFSNVQLQRNTDA